MSRAIWAIAFAAMLSPVSAFAQTSVVGCWIIESLLVDPAGAKMEPLGRPPVGQITFTGDGHMSFIVMHHDLPAEYQVTDERISTKLIAYFGTYELQGKTMTIKINGSSRADFRNHTATRVIETLTPNQIAISTESPAVPVRIVAKRC